MAQLNQLDPALSLSHNSAVKKLPETPKVELVSQLLERLAGEGIRYCHWKSTFSLQRALRGDGDLDLLVDRKHSGRLESVLGLLGFKRVTDSLRGSSPAIAHFFAPDPSTGIWIHLHVYYRLITGESLFKNYSLPLEELVLEDPRTMEGMPIAQPGAELIVFMLRMMVKYSSVTEHLVHIGNQERLFAELEALLVDETAVLRAGELLERWLPGVDRQLFYQCVESLRKRTWWGHRFWVARRLRRQLRSLGRFPSLVEMVRRVGVYSREGVSWLLRGRGTRYHFASGGAVIAFIGPDASGKSTLVAESADWLREVFRVQTGHLGKPPSTWLTFLPNLARRLLLAAVPKLRRPEALAARQRWRSGQGTGEPGNAGGPSLLYSIRLILTAWDRRAYAVRLRRAATNGGLVLCDRYPSAVVGASDSAVLQESNGKPGRSRLRRFLARLENRLYRQIPPPDIVIHVVAPLQIAVERNRERHELGKDKSDAYLTYNHENLVLPSFPNAHTVDFDTSQPRSASIQEIRQILWKVL